MPTMTDPAVSPSVRVIRRTHDPEVTPVSVRVVDSQGPALRFDLVGLGKERLSQEGSIESLPRATGNVHGLKEIQDDGTGVT